MQGNFDQHRYDLLKAAIARRVGVEDEMAGQLALRVLNYFGFENDIIDNKLDQEDRKMFYFMQDVGLMKTAWEEALLANGRTWRIFYWFLNVEHIEEYAGEIEHFGPEPELYDSLPECVWTREEA
jgi:hypothetical protein